MRLWRAHGLGNDYLVLEDGPPLDAALVREVCDRHRGVGGDGILEPTQGEGADHGVRIWNPDGSIAEKSGNGLRIFARWLADHGAGERFSVWTGHDVVRCAVGTTSIAVEMGRAVVGEAEAVEVGGAPLVIVPVDVGNPHAVVWRDETALDALPWRDWGRLLEVHPRFPNRTNVQVARVVDRGTAEARIWERGAGETLASGSSSCAIAASGVATGRLDRDVTVRMPGGALRVRVGDDGVVLEGPVEGVGTITVDAAWLRARGR